LILAIVTFACKISYGQVKTAKQIETELGKMKSGNYFRNPNQAALVGVWHSDDQHYTFSVKLEKKHVQKGGENGLDFYTDMLLLTFKRATINGSDHYEKFASPIELIGLDGLNFNGFYLDPITKNNVSVSLNFKNGKAQLLSKILPPNSVESRKDGISFPYRLVFKKE